MRLTYVEFLGQKHPLCFSLAAVEKLVESFGSLDHLADALSSGDIAQLSASVDQVFRILMEAGRIYAKAIGEDLPPELPCRPADLIDVRDKSELQVIFDAMKMDSARTVETAPKNGEAAAGQ